MGNGQHLLAQNMGSGAILTPHNQFKLNKILHVPSLSTNLFLVRELLGAPQVFLNSPHVSPFLTSPQLFLSLPQTLPVISLSNIKKEEDILEVFG